MTRTSTHGPRALFDGRWRYVWHLPRETGGQAFEELYDTATDPDELTNLAPAAAGESAVALQRLRVRLIEKLVETETTLPLQDHLEA